MLYASEENFAFLHAKHAISFIIFVGTQDICWYDMAFNLEILGGGVIIQAIPHLKYWGIYPPPPFPRDRHPWTKLYLQSVGVCVCSEAHQSAPPIFL